MKAIIEILEKYDMDTYHWKLEIAKEINQFIKKNYVNKKQHDVIVKTADKLLLKVKDSYPKEFVRWLMMGRDIIISIDELFDYWQKEVKE